MKMYCINPGNIKNLTFGKDYIITNRQTGNHQGSNKQFTGLWVINDAERKHYYSSKRFVEIDVWRDMVINKLLQDEI